MTDDAEQVSLKAMNDAVRRMRGHLRSLDVWIEQQQMTLHAMRHEMTKMVCALQLREMAENEQETENRETRKAG